MLNPLVMIRLDTVKGFKTYGVSINRHLFARHHAKIDNGFRGEPVIEIIDLILDVLNRFQRIETVSHNRDASYRFGPPLI